MDARTDLFSFGIVLYEMATGVRPFTGDSSGAILNAIINQTPTPPVRLNPQVSRELGRIINKALEKRPELRYQSAAEMRVDLTRAVRSTQWAFSQGGRPHRKRTVLATQQRPPAGTARSRRPGCTCRNRRGRVVDAKPDTSGLPCRSTRTAVHCA